MPARPPCMLLRSLEATPDLLGCSHSWASSSASAVSEPIFASRRRRSGEKAGLSYRRANAGLGWAAVSMRCGPSGELCRDETGERDPARLAVADGAKLGLLVSRMMRGPPA